MPAFSDFAHALRGAPLKIKYVSVFALGCFLAFFALAPWRLFFVFFIVMPLIIWMLDGVKGWRQSFGLGFFFGSGYFLIGFYWVGHAFLISPVPQLAPVAVVGLVALLALFWGVAFAAARHVWPKNGARLLCLTFFWAIAFWAQGWVATGLPWNLPAQSWIFSEALAQNFSWAGLYGANFLMILCSVSFASLAEKKRLHAIAPPLFASALLALLWIGGQVRLAAAEAQFTKTHIAIIQPNIAQRDKWDINHRARIIETYFAMSAKAVALAKKNPTILIWPEAALPININRAPFIKQALADLLPENMLLITGLLRFEGRQAFNSLFMIDHSGEIKQTYDKNHLVAFGEYLPFQNLLEYLGVQQITGKRGGYASGSTRALLKQNHMPPALPLICFEIAFPQEISPSAHAQWIVNLTNDGWYGESSGPHQHFDLARLRAIEFGLPVVRAANTGISAIIDPYGRVQQKAALASVAIVRGKLPAAIAPTFYAQWREWIFIVFLLIAAILVVFVEIRSRKNT